MDWGFLNIFKRADFNTLMFSFALTSWILLYKYPENVYFLGATIFFSIYCISRLAVYLFNSYKVKKLKKANRLYEQQQQEKKIQEKRIHAQFVYDRLSEKSKKIFSDLIKSAKKSSYSNAYILHDKISCLSLMDYLQHVKHSDSDLNSWINIDDNGECITIYIKPPLNDIIESNSK